jgi:hypothetical protein
VGAGREELLTKNKSLAKQRLYRLRTSDHFPVLVHSVVAGDLLKAGTLGLLSWDHSIITEDLLKTIIPGLFSWDRAARGQLRLNVGGPVTDLFKWEVLIITVASLGLSE